VKVRFWTPLLQENYEVQNLLPQLTESKRFFCSAKFIVEKINFDWRWNCILQRLRADGIWSYQLSLRTTAHAQHFRTWYLTGHALGTYRRALTLRWWPESVIPSKMHHFSPANRPTFWVLQGQISKTLFLVNVYGLTPDLSGNKTNGLWIGTRISISMPPSWQGMAQIQPPIHPWPHIHKKH